MWIEATNIFRYRIIRLNEKTYVVDLLPHWYSIVAGLFICFLEKKAYLIDYEQEKYLQRRSFLDKLSLFWGPAIAVFSGSFIRHILRFVDFEVKNSEGQGTKLILSLFFIIFLTYGIWRIYEKRKFFRIVSSQKGQIEIRIKHKPFTEAPKMYFMCVITELFCQGNFYIFTILLATYPNISIDETYLVIYILSAFLYFFVIAFLPDKLINYIEQGEKRSV